MENIGFFGIITITLQINSLQINFMENIGFSGINTLIFINKRIATHFIENIEFSGNKRDFISLNGIYLFIQMLMNSQT